MVGPHGPYSPDDGSHDPGGSRDCLVALGVPDRPNGSGGPHSPSCPHGPGRFYALNHQIQI